MRSRDAVVLAGASGTRFGFSAVYTVAAARVLDGSDTAYLLQALLLQGGLMAFMSASAFARGSYAASLPDTGLWSTAASYRRFVVGTTCVLLAPFILFAPAAGIGWADRAVVGVMLVVGAAASAVNAFLQGAVSVRETRSLAFTPSLQVGLAGTLAIGLLPILPTVMTCALVWSGVQIAAPLLLVWRTELSRGLVRRSSQHATRRFGDVGIAMVGVANALFVVALVVFRESWAANRDPGVVEAAYTAARLFELVMQICFMILASSPARVARLLKRLRASRRTMITAAVVASFLAALPVAQAVWRPESSVLRFLAAETTTLPVRVIATGCLVALLQRPNTRPYVAVVSLTGAGVVGLIWVEGLRSQLFGLSIAQGVIAGATVLLTLGALSKAPAAENRG